MRNAKHELLICAAALLLSFGLCAADEPVGKGSRLFVTKCYLRHGKLNEADFR